MKISQLRYFSAVAACGSISAAAQKLGVSQPAVSSAIKELEKELGAVLFKRTGKNVVPTTLGYEVRGSVDNVLALLRTIAERSGKAGEKGFVTVWVHPQLSSLITRDIVVPYQKSNPNSEVLVRNASLAEVEEELHGGRASIAVSILPPGTDLQTLSPGSRGGRVLLFHAERKLYLGRTHPLANAAEISREQLSTVDLAYYSHHSDEISILFRKFFRNEYRLAEREDILDLVVRGEAACIQAAESLKGNYRLQKGLLVEKNLPDLGFDSKVPAVAFRGENLLPAEQEIWDLILKKYIGGNEPDRL